MTVQTIDVIELQEKLQRGEVLLIDVRESGEFANDHIIQAISLPLSGIDQHLTALAGESRPLVFQCQKGMRSKMAADKAAAVLQGKTIFNLTGGFEAWQAANLPTTCCTNRGLPILRQVFLAAGGLIFFFSLLALLGLKFGAVMTLLISCGLLISGATGFCGLTFLLHKMPWNKKQ